ncbi:translationally-controlled tumor protein homolog [Mytilus galloprovincialis]|uniref:Translationally-controlled tumor protein homolog n=1 Tax=Mytilus galloprovincialis TaxID=29158 RepID=G9G141_MYTGA|nr:TCTP [Mytilus galloprovincialis]VDI45558.1 Hypothetical predicted protein [Mytilus galloprovincialis]
MIIYRCKISGDELFSDAFEPMIVKEDFFYEIEGKNISVSNKIDESAIGANASAEEAAEGQEDLVETKINVIYSHKLQETSFDKKGFQTFIKEYIKVLLAKIEEEKGKEAADEFKKRAATGVKKVLENFKNWQFFQGENMADGGMIVLMDYREDGVTPYFWFVKDGIIAEKY